MFHLFHQFHGVYKAEGDLYVPPVPLGVYGWELIACSTSSTYSTGFIWLGEICMFHLFHGVNMAGCDLHVPPVPPVLPVPRGVYGW